MARAKVGKGWRNGARTKGKGSRERAVSGHEKGHPVKGAPLGCGCLVFTEKEAQHQIKRHGLPECFGAHRENLDRTGAMASIMTALAQTQKANMAKGRQSGN